MEETKRCSFCGEKILAVAIKCRYCNEWFNDRPSPQGSTSDSHSGSRPFTSSANTPLTGIHLVKHALGDRYKVLEEIGSGGMATVYKATQKNLGRTVALKVIHQNLVHDQEFVKRFHREAQISASLQHPNIVTIYDVGEAQGVHYMAMEYLEGTNLHELIDKQGRFTQQQTLKYLFPVAEALDYAHGRGYIHRDIKSANIFVTGSGHVVLMDFGIAHAAVGTQLTRAGTVIGTPEYMSPEQAEGKKVDHRTDIYSLGVVMYECLAGKVPFKGDSAITTIYKLLHEQPNPRDLQHLPANVKTFIQKLLSKNADHRHGKINEILSQIKQIEAQFHQSKVSITHRDSAKLPDPKMQTDKQVAVHKTTEASYRNTSQKDHDETIIIPGENAPGKEKHFSAITVEPIGLEMVYVEGGEFIMGCTSEQGNDCYDDERPAHKVSLTGFYIGRYPVTQGQWRQVMGSNPSHFGGSDDCPVESVSWNDVQEFIDKVNNITGEKFCLPTEAQWEFAARGGNNSNGYKYAGSNIIDEIAWYAENSGCQTHPVRQKRANELGIYDMSGNVLEWCSDYYGSYHQKTDVNPKGSLYGVSRVLRGGSWSSNAQGCRTSDRLQMTPDNSTHICGLRLSLSVF